MTAKFYLLSAAFAAISFSSCKKDGHHREIAKDPFTLNVDVKSGETYQLGLSQYGEGTAVITKQASAYSVSEISNHVYKFSSLTDLKAGSSNKEQVMLKISVKEGREGGCRNKSSETNITINFSIR